MLVSAVLILVLVLTRRILLVVVIALLRRPSARMLLEARDDVAGEEDGALVGLVERGGVGDAHEDVHVGGVHGRAVREAELGDELVPEDVHVGGGERGGHRAGRGGCVRDCMLDGGCTEGWVKIWDERMRGGSVTCAISHCVIADDDRETDLG